jgi:hypothetical protein
MLHCHLLIQWLQLLGQWHRASFSPWQQLPYGASNTRLCIYEHETCAQGLNFVEEIASLDKMDAVQTHGG